MDKAAVEWSVGMDPNLAIDAWSTAALLAAVLEALLEEPEKLAVALRVLAGATT